MRAANLALVLHEIVGTGPLSRARVAERTGLTKSSVSGLSADLIAGRLLLERAAQPAGDRGRPGITLALDPQGAAGLGLEVNVDYLAAVLVDLSGVPRYRHVERHDHRTQEPAQVLGRLAGLAELAAAAAREQQLPLAGVCLAVPGAVDGDLLRRAPNLGWRDVDVVSPLRDAVGELPLGVSAENEANLAALGELWFGVGTADFVHVSGEIGIGGGLVVDGELFRGSHALAGELGHVVVDPDGPRCSCGGFGCLERIAGQQAILAAAGAEDLPDLVARCREGDRRALGAVADAGRSLGVALASAVSLLDPSAVVLGGSFAQLDPWLSDAVSGSLHRHAPSANVSVLTSRLGGDAAIRGAAGVVIRRLVDDPAGYLARVAG